jgi:hypothetical protein
MCVTDYIYQNEKLLMNLFSFSIKVFETTK